MLCPKCSQPLSKQKNGMLLCPLGHGRLMSGKHLKDIKDVPSAPSHTPTANTNKTISCPHCSSDMHKVNYNNTDVIIDACASCHYRWLDAGEVEKIQTHKPEIPAEDLMFIVGVDEQIRESSQVDTKDPNPRLPLQGSYRAGSEVVGAVSGNSGKVRLAAIFGQGLFGFLKGMTHSRTSRILTLITVVALGLTFYLVFLASQEAFGI